MTIYGYFDQACHIQVSLVVFHRHFCHLLLASAASIEASLGWWPLVGSRSGKRSVDRSGGWVIDGNRGRGDRRQGAAEQQWFLLCNFAFRWQWWRPAACTMVIADSLNSCCSVSVL